mgnify:CR=1 FL=1
MIAYRAETAMVNIIRGYILKKDEVRALVRQIFMTDADMELDEKSSVLNILSMCVKFIECIEYVCKECREYRKYGF